MSISGHLESILEDMRKTFPARRKKKVHTTDLEKMIKCRFKFLSDYRNNGGYEAFATAINELIEKNILSEVKSSPQNGREPTLKKMMWLNNEKIENAWDDSFVFEMSDLLDLSWYRLNKEYQTRQEYIKIKKIHNFLNSRENYNVVKREERSLMLFNNVFTNKVEAEKYLGTDEGKIFIKRLGLTLDDLKCKAAKEPFHYWKNVLNPIYKNDNNDSYYREVLIIEGLATYTTIKELLMNNMWDFSIQPYLLIWGAGKRIISSFEFIEEVIGKSGDLNIYYFGDIDPEGYTIYQSLKEHYPNYHIELASELYETIAEIGYGFRRPIEKEQVYNEDSFVLMINELKGKTNKICSTIKNLWEQKERIPQEAFNLDTLETWKKGEKICYLRKPEKELGVGLNH